MDYLERITPSSFSITKVCEFVVQLPCMPYYPLYAALTTCWRFLSPAFCRSFNKRIQVFADERARHAVSGNIDTTCVQIFAVQIHCEAVIQHQILSCLVTHVYLLLFLGFNCLRMQISTTPIPIIRSPGMTASWPFTIKAGLKWFTYNTNRSFKL